MYRHGTHQQFDYYYIGNQSNQENTNVSVVITPPKQTYKSYVIEK